MGAALKTEVAAERRSSERVATTLRGKAFPGGVDCKIKDMSKGGVRLTFLGPPPAGDRLIVVVWSTGAAIELARRWRNGGEAGFEVLGRFDFRSRVPQRLASLRAQWIARRPKLRRSQLNDGSVLIGYRGSLRAVQPG